MRHIERHGSKYLAGITVASVITTVVACIGWSHSNTLLDIMEQRYVDANINALRYRYSAVYIAIASIESNIKWVTMCDSLKLELLNCRNRRPSVPAVPTKKPCKVVCIQTPLKPSRIEHDNHVLSHEVVCDTPTISKQRCIPGLYENLMGRLPITGRYPDSTGGVWRGIYKDCK